MCRFADLIGNLVTLEIQKMFQELLNTLPIKNTTEFEHMMLLPDGKHKKLR
jgi:hypothetical protein